MRKTYEPAIVIPGGSRVLEKAPPHRQQTDKKGRPIWNLPKPVAFAEHFRNAAARREFEAGRLPRQAAVTLVPVLRGFDARTAHMYRGMVKRDRRISDETPVVEKAASFTKRIAAKVAAPFSRATTRTINRKAGFGNRGA